LEAFFLEAFFLVAAEELGGVAVGLGVAGEEDGAGPAGGGADDPGPLLDAPVDAPPPDSD
jgi:hypothetical protein